MKDQTLHISAPGEKGEVKYIIMIEESCKSNSQLSVESNAEVHWFCIVLLHANHTPDWRRKLGPLYQLFIIKGN